MEGSAALTGPEISGEYGAVFDKRPGRFKT
jgi:hypothetical protein